MADLVVITPTRGRPVQAARLADAIRETTLGRAELLLLVDDDDPYRGAYLEAFAMRPGVFAAVAARAGLVGSTNVGARMVLDRDAEHRPEWLASLGDDHLPRTPNWDLRLIDAIRRMNGPGWAYGNDLLQGRGLPTAWVQHASTVDLLGWMMLPTLGHMYPDNVVLDLGGADRLAYVPGVIIEHLHPLAGKSQVDESYAETGRPEQYDRDRAAYRQWREGRMAVDRDAVHRLTWAGVPAPC